MVTDLHPLSTSLKPCNHVDISNIRYLNQSCSPIVNPLSKHLNIEIYNETWFDKPTLKSQPLFDYNHPTLAFSESQLIPFSSLSNLHAETNTFPPSPLTEKSDTDILSPPSPTFYQNVCLYLIVYSSSATPP